MAKYAFLAAAMAAVAPLVGAQTYSSCNPTQQSGCPPKAGLNSADPVVIDFTQGASSDFSATSGTINYDSNGAQFTINNITDGPTLASNYQIFFGYVEATVQAAPGQGIVSSFILESDDLDEIDWEMIGSQDNQAQSNYFGKGNTTTYDRGQFDAVTNPQTSVHTYAVDWQPTNTTWLIDGQVVRTLQYSDAVGGSNYPQTPMNIRLGNWVAGNPSNSPGTIQWAGGLADMSQAPFTMTVQSVKIINYYPAVAYSYGDNTGSFESIKLWNTSTTNDSETSKPSSKSSSSSEGENKATSTSNEGENKATSSSSANRAAGSTITINTGRGGGSASTSRASTASGNVAAGIVATGSFTASTQPVFTVLVGSNGGSSGSKPTSGGSNSMTTQVSQPLTTSNTASSAPAQQTKNAGTTVSETGLSSLSVVLAAIFAIML